MRARGLGRNLWFGSELDEQVPAVMFPRDSVVAYRSCALRCLCFAEEEL
jgi:hypothetical protein